VTSDQSPVTFDQNGRGNDERSGAGVDRQQFDQGCAGPQGNGAESGKRAGQAAPGNPQTEGESGNRMRWGGEKSPERY